MIVPIILVLLAIGGYFAYKHFKKDAAKKTEEVVVAEPAVEATCTQEECCAQKETPICCAGDCCNKEVCTCATGVCCHSTSEFTEAPVEVAETAKIEESVVEEVKEEVKSKPAKKKPAKKVAKKAKKKGKSK
jgi:hypothetical protein